MWLCSAPSPPTNVKVVSFDQHEITFTFTPAPNSEEFTYSLTITSVFWGHSYSEMLHNKNIYTISGLMSGTRYQLELQTMVGQISSDPVSFSQTTGETHRDHHTLIISY